MNHSVQKEKQLKTKYKLQFNNEIAGNYPFAPDFPVVVRCVGFAIRHLLVSRFVNCFAFIILNLVAISGVTRQIITGPLIALILYAAERGASQPQTSPANVVGNETLWAFRKERLK